MAFAILWSFEFFRVVLSDNVYFFALELHGTVFLREQGVVSSHTDVLAGMELCSALGNDDCACLCGLASEELEASVLCVRVSSVS